MYQHILVPVDGAALSQMAAKQAVTFASQVGARITFLYARPEQPSVYAGLGAISAGSIHQQIADQLDQAASAILSQAEQLAQAAQVPCELLSKVSDEPWHCIIEVAHNCACDLIFMASHGRTGASALLLGSETNKVLTHCKLPVLVYR